MKRSSTTSWRPTGDLASLRARAELLSQIRAYFASEQVMEVETPLASASTVTDPYLEAFQVDGKYLQTSPEYAMKRLLAAGCGDIYQIAKAFRQEESGRYHNPEFTLLEWYRLNFSLEQMFAEIDSLLQLTLGTASIQIARYPDLFEEHLAIDTHTISDRELIETVRQQCGGLELTDRDDCLTTLFASIIEPRIGVELPCIVSHFPAAQASLARLDAEDPRLARRFEVYFKGVELANGFHELTDADEQAMRFAVDNQKRRDSNKPEKPIDQMLLNALRAGLPDCVGVALGIDRLLMLKLGKGHISDVLSFDSTNA